MEARGRVARSIAVYISRIIKLKDNRLGGKGTPGCLNGNVVIFYILEDFLPRVAA